MKRLAVTTLALAIAAVAGGASAATRYDNGYNNGYNQQYDNSNHGGNYDETPRADVAQVTNVSPILEQVQAQPRQECWNEPAPHYGTNGYSNGQAHPNNVGGTILGAIIGGALGNQVGKGDGRTAATIAGAVAGGAIGRGVARNNDQYNNQQYNGQSGTVQRCRTVSDNYQAEPRVVGYDVTYRYAGQTYHTTTPYHPGKTLRVAVMVRPQDESGVAYR